MSEYKRLTKWETSKGVKCVKYWQYSQEQIAERLALLEDKIEQGKLIELPCKVGGMVYVIDTFNMEVVEWYFGFDMLGRIGKTVFLTKAEAEEKLRELEFKQRVDCGNSAIVED